MKVIGQSAVVNISMPVKMLEELDYWAEKTVQKRSGLIQNALRQYLRLMKFQYKHKQ